MAEGRAGAEKVRSRQAAVLIALLANIHRRRGGRAYRADDFDPYADRIRRGAARMRVTPENWDAFIAAFVGGDGKGRHP